MIVAIVVLLVGVGTVVFHFWSPWWWTPIASNWGYVDDTIIVTFWITGAVFVAVILFMAYCIFRYRYRENRRAEYEPENKKLETWLVILTTVGVAGMLTPGLIVWNQYVSVPEEAAEVEALGQQWQWTFRYPGEDGVLGTTDTRRIDFDNTFGLDPDDPNGQDDILIESGEIGLDPDDPNGQDDILIESSEMHLPIDQPVKMLLRSTDVLHDFYVPQFRAKMDIVPGSQVWSPSSGSCPPKSGHTRSSASNCAALGIMPCVARSWWRGRAPIRRGWKSNRRSRK
jgi:cytochrome c oxidase subunit 2